AARASAVGAVPARLHSPDFAVNDTVRAYRTAVEERQTVILALPLDVQAGQCQPPGLEQLAAARPGPGKIARAGRKATGPGERARLLRGAESAPAPAKAEAPARLAEAIRRA